MPNNRSLSILPANNKKRSPIQPIRNQCKPIAFLRKQEMIRELTESAGSILDTHRHLAAKEGYQYVYRSQVKKAVRGICPYNKNGKGYVDYMWQWKDNATRIVLQHHQRLNGSGYPKGLTDEEILPEAKSITVADAVEAMPSHRPYRPAFGMDMAIGETRAGQGVKCHKQSVDACLSLLLDKKYEGGSSCKVQQ